MIREVYCQCISAVIAPPTSLLQMKSDFHRMEDEMTLLSGKMQEIMSASTSINSALSNRRQQIAKLSGVHHLLKKVTEPYCSDGCHNITVCAAAVSV